MMLQRRRKKKTDYRARLALLKSKKKRVVVRRSNRYITVSLVDYKKNGDITLSSFSSKSLKSFGWTLSAVNTPAAYLTGLAAGKKFKKKAKEGVLDLGMMRATKGGVVFAVLKGLVDAGFSVPHGDENMPDEKRIRGETIASYGKSKYAAKAPELFEKVKKKIGVDDGKKI